jgi:hypothetical protein
MKTALEAWVRQQSAPSRLWQGVTDAKTVAATLPSQVALKRPVGINGPFDEESDGKTGIMVQSKDEAIKKLPHLLTLNRRRIRHPHPVEHEHIVGNDITDFKVQPQSCWNAAYEFRRGYRIAAGE